MKTFVLVSLLLLCSSICFGQVVTDQKEAERIYKKSLIEAKIESQFALANDKCRELLREKKFGEAESACKIAATNAEKLPVTRYVERYSTYKALGLSFVWQRKFEQAISSFNKSLEVAKPHLDETDSETGDIYYFLGQTYHLLVQVDKARDFYTKAENVYRTAFKEIGDDEFFLRPYAKTIKGILEAHLFAAEDAGLKDEASKIKKRLEDTKVEFAKFLEN